MTVLASAAALLGQEIFVAGGQADKEVINSAEIYNPELNQWEQMVARMEVSRVGLAMVSMGNLIYAIGEEIFICCSSAFSKGPMGVHLTLDLDLGEGGGGYSKHHWPS